MSTAVQCEPEFRLNPLWSDAGADLSTISQAMGDLSTAVTNWLRRMDSSQYVDQSATRKPGPESGIVISTTVCTEFDRYWLLLPVTLLAASLASLAMMVGSNHRDRRQVWK